MRSRNILRWPVLSGAGRVACGFREAYLQLIQDWAIAPEKQRELREVMPDNSAHVGLALTDAMGCR